MHLLNRIYTSLHCPFFRKSNYLVNIKYMQDYVGLNKEGIYICQLKYINHVTLMTRCSCNSVIAYGVISPFLSHNSYNDVTSIYYIFSFL